MLLHMKYDVFISYSRRDYVDENKNVIPNNFVSKFKEALTKADITFWFDEEGIHYGQNFVEKIVTNIENSKIFLFLSTENSNQSEWTCKEIACAAEFKKYIIPVRIDESPYNRKVLFRIADLNYIEYYTNPKKGMQELIESIKTYLDECAAEEKRMEEENKRKENENTSTLHRQREEKLRECHENIVRLEQQREELIDEKLNHEKELALINSKLELLEHELTSLKEDERILLTANHNTNEKFTDRALQESILSKEINDLRKAFRTRHLILNVVEILYFICFIATGFVSLFMTIKSTDINTFSCMTAYSYLGFVGVYRLMKNNKDCFYWLFPLFPFIIFMIPFMFIRKNKRSAWKVLHNTPTKLMDDPIYLIMVFFLVIGVLGTMALILI